MRRIIRPTKIIATRQRKHFTSINRNEERRLIRKFKLKKKKNKEKLKTKLLENIKEEPTAISVKNVKLEVEDVLLNPDIVQPYSLPTKEEVDGSTTINSTNGERSVNVNERIDEEEEEHKELRCWKYRDLDNLQLLFNYPYQVVCIKGSCSLHCIHGQIEVNGKLIDQATNSVNLLSQGDSSLLYIADTSLQVLVVTEELIETLISKIKQEVGSSLTSAMVKNLIGFMEDLDGELSSCVLIRKKAVPLYQVLKRFNDYKPAESIHLYGKPFPYPSLNTMNWKSIMDDVIKRKECFQDCNFSMLICGGKDVGKSSFARYAVNTLLNCHETVFFLDCDCGQTEFTPPAILSLVKITKPLLGPPFTHIMKPVRSVFFGHISPKDTPSEYVSIIESLFTTYMEIGSSFGPLIINQQGWVKGLGLSILIDCIRVINPYFVIQMHSEQETRNLPQVINDHFMNEQAGWTIPKTYKGTHQSKHERHYIFVDYEKIPSNIQKSKGVSSRNLSITSYFSSFFLGNTTSGKKAIPRSLTTVPPYAIGFCDIALHVIHEKVTCDMLLYAFNESVVCLSRVSEDQIVKNPNGPCYLDSQTKFFEYYGLGIVRNIDPANGILYILTPEPMEVLDNVNVLVKGNVQLPQSYLMQEEKGSHPYLCYDYDSCNAIGSSAMKPRFNLKRNPSRLSNHYGEE